MAKEKCYIKKKDGFHQVEILRRIHSWGRPGREIKGYSISSCIIIPKKYVRDSSIIGFDTKEKDLKISTFRIIDTVPVFYVVSRREVWSKNKLVFNLTGFYFGKKITIKMETDVTIPESSISPHQIMIQTILNNFPGFFGVREYAILSSAKDITTYMNNERNHPLTRLGEQPRLMDDMLSYIPNVKEAFAKFYKRTEDIM